MSGRRRSSTTQSKAWPRIAASASLPLPTATVSISRSSSSSTIEARSMSSSSTTSSRLVCAAVYSLILPNAASRPVVVGSLTR